MTEHELRFPPSDPGLEAVSHIAEKLCPEKEWTVAHSRGFTWWGGTLAQTVRAEEQRDGWRVRVTTDLLRGVPFDEERLEAVNNANRFASLSAVVWDRSRRTVALSCVATVDRENVAELKSLLSWAAALQVAAAHVRVDDMEEVFDADADTSGHPESGLRPGRAPVLTTIWRLGLSSAGPTPFNRSELARALEGVRGGKVLSSEEDRVQVELSAGARLEIATDAEHLALGRGALVRLRFPGSDDGRGMLRAVELNHTEQEESGAPHLLGAWRMDPDDSLVFCTFLPAGVFQAGLLATLARNASRRHAWIAARGTAPR
jgi:hypothetical protein